VVFTLGAGGAFHAAKASGVLACERLDGRPGIPTFERSSRGHWFDGFRRRAVNKERRSSDYATVAGSMSTGSSSNARETSSLFTAVDTRS
jgi:hypothetical protein